MPRPAKFADEELLDGAYEVLWREGCDAVSIRDLEKALDLKAPSIYRRFGSRDELIARSVERYVERVVRKRIKRFLENSTDPLEGLRVFFYSALEPMPGESSPRGCLLTTTAGQTAYEHEHIRSAVGAGLLEIEEAFRVQLLRARAAGLLPEDVDVAAIAASLLLAFEGLLVLARGGRTGLRTAVEATLYLHLQPTRQQERTTHRA